MDFHSLLRRDLQSLCKRNKIPANMTNVAMADSLKALEIVEGLDEYMNQSDSNAPQSPTAVAKQPPKTVTRTTRRKTTTKSEPQPSSKLVTSSCQLKNKNLAGEMEQESKINKVKFDANVGKTPAARSTRKTSAATSCIIKVQESKKNESLQSVYSTRRSTRLLGKVMGGLSLETKETLDKPEENECTEQKVSALENTPAADSEDEVIPSRDLSASMDKEWEMSKNDSDHEIGDHMIDADLGDVSDLDANTETMDEVKVDEKESMNSLVQEETSQANKAMCEEVQEKNDNDQEIGNPKLYVDLGDITPALDDANNDKEEPKNVLAFEQVEQQEAVQQNDSEPEEFNTLDEEDTMVVQTGSDAGDSETEPEEIFTFDEKDTMVEQTDSDAGDSETEPEEVDADITISEPKNVLALEQVDQQETEAAVQEKDSETEKINSFDEDTMVEQTGSDDKGDSEIEPEEDNSGVNADGTISEPKNVLAWEHVDQQETDEAIQEKVSEPEKINTFDEVAMVDQTDSDAGDSVTEPEEDKSGVDADGTFSEPKNVLALEQVDQQETEAAMMVMKDSELEKINTIDEEPMVDQTGTDADDTISEADSNQAVFGSDIADEEMIVSESLPLSLEEAEVKTTPLSPISVQFPRQNKSATPSKNSALKLVNVENKDKENNMTMMNVNYGETKKKKKKVAIDEEKLKEASIRQLVKMVKELSIKSTSRTALQILPGNNQTAE